MQPQFVVECLQKKLKRELQKANRKSIYAQYIKETIDELKTMPPLHPLKYSHTLSVLCERYMARLGNEQNVMEAINKHEELEESIAGCGLGTGEKGVIVFYGKE